MLLNLLLVAIILVCIALVVAILLQRSEGGALGMSGGGPGAFMTARGTGDFLSSATQVLAALFFGLCLIMTLISGHDRATSSVIDRVKLNALSRPSLAAPAAPVAPPPAATTPAAPVLSQPASSTPTNTPTPLNPFGPNTAAAPAGTSAPPARR